MPATRIAAALVLAVLFAAPRPGASTQPSAKPGTEPGAKPGADPAAELRAAELAFAATVAEGDRDGFAAFLDEEAVFVGATVLRGKQAIVDGWAVFFAEGGPRLVWEPEIVEVRADGLGLSRGPYTLTLTTPEGGESTSSGIFTSIWRRGADGSWKVLFDAGCPPCAAAGSPGG